MSATHEYFATVAWERNAQAFTDNRYSRAHQWRFDGGAVVRGSSSPLVVRTPMSDAGAVDPEEAFVASLSSCHMLFFLNYAATSGFVVDRYEDAAVGTMGKDERGLTCMLEVVLRPRIAWGGERQPTPDQVHALHERSHHDCYIANSVRTRVRVEGGNE